MLSLDLIVFVHIFFILLETCGFFRFLYPVMLVTLAKYFH